MTKNRPRSPSKRPILLRGRPPGGFPTVSTACRLGSLCIRNAESENRPPVLRASESQSSMRRPNRGSHRLPNRHHARPVENAILSVVARHWSRWANSRRLMSLRRRLQAHRVLLPPRCARMSEKRESAPAISGQSSPRRPASKPAGDATRKNWFGLPSRHIFLFTLQALPLPALEVHVRRECGGRKVRLL